MCTLSWTNSIRSLYIALWLCLLLATGRIASAQQLPAKYYSSAEGLAHDRVMRIMRDSRGFLWFCTVDGLSRFDGAQFTTYNKEQGLPFPYINDILEARPGEYWLATNGAGLVLMDLRTVPQSQGKGITQPRFKIYRIADRPNTRRVNMLRRDRAGRIWVGTDGGLFLLEEAQGDVRFSPVKLGLASDPDELVAVMAFMEDRDGNVWLGTSAGLVRRSPDGRAIRYLADPSPGDRLVRAVLQDRDGRIWVSHQMSIIAFKPLPITEPGAPTPPKMRTLTTGLPEAPGDLRRFTSVDHLAAIRVRVLFQSIDGRIWAGSSDGLSEFDGERFRMYTPAQGAGGGSINSMVEDSDGNLWIGTDLSGAIRLARNGFVSFKRSDGLPNPWMTAFFEDDGGALYTVNGGTIGINRFDGKRFTAVKLNLPEAIVRSGTGFPILTIRDHAGEWWAPTPKGLYRFTQVPRIEDLARAQPKALYLSKDGLATDAVGTVFEDSHHNLWIGGLSPARENLTRWDRATGNFHRYSERDGVPGFSIPACFGEDAGGNLWIGFEGGGLARYRDQRFTLFTESDGVPAGDLVRIYLDRAGRLWVTSTEGGLAHVENPTAQHPKFVTYTKADGLSSNDVRCLTEDAWGRLYIGTARGIDRMDLSTRRVKHYTPADGLAASEVLVAYRERSGMLWFATYEGLSRLIPEADRPDPLPPVLIGALRIDGVSRAISSLGEIQVAIPELEPQQNHVEIDFFGLRFGSGGALRYQYKLEGPDLDWSTPTTQRTVNYANLAPGAYRFLVRALTPDGVVSPAPASVAFTILEPVWRRPWFITLVIVSTALSVFAFDRYRVARIKEVKAALAESQRLTGELTVQGEQLSQANQALELEYTVTRIVAEVATPADATPGMLHAICESTGWEIGVIWNVDPQTHLLHCVDTWHLPDTAITNFEILTRERGVLPGEGLPGRVLADGQPLWVTDLRQADNLPRTEAAANEGFSSAFCFPLLFRGDVIGVLEFFSRERREPDAGQMKTMATIGVDIGQLIGSKRAEEALRESETRFRTFAETAADVIITIDASGVIIFVNPAAERVFGHPQNHMIGAPLTMLMPEYLRHLHEAGFERYQKTGVRAYFLACNRIAGTAS